MKERCLEHCSDESLVAHLDGELSLWKDKAVHKHVQTCWECRRRLAEFEQEMMAVTEAADGYAFPGPQRIVAARMRFFATVKNLTDRPTPLVFLRLYPRLGVCMGICAVLVVTLAWMFVARKMPLRFPDSKPTVSVVLARAKDAELQTRPGPVYQEFRVVLSKTVPEASRRESHLRIWSDSGQQRFASRWEDSSGMLKYAVWRPEPGREYIYNPARSKIVYRVVHQCSGETAVAPVPDRMLALADLESAFISWLETRCWTPVLLAALAARFANEADATLGIDAVSGPDRERLLRLSARRDVGRFVIELQMDVEPESYRPRFQRLRYRTADGIFELQMIPEAPRPAPVAVFEPDRPLLISSIPAARTDRPLAFVTESKSLTAIPDLTTVEIEALYALHGVRACLGEPVEVLRGASGVFVRAVASTAERQRQLVEALTAVGYQPWLHFDIETTNEALTHLGSASTHIMAPLTVPAFPLPTPLLKKYLPSASRSDASKAAAQFSEEVLSRCELLVSEAWALQALAENHGNTDIRQLSGQAAWALEAMLNDHLMGLDLQISGLRKLLEPVLGGIAGQADQAIADRLPHDSPVLWSAEVFRIFEQSKEVHNLSRELLTGRIQDGYARAIARQLTRDLAVLPSELQQTAQTARSVFGARNQITRRTGLLSGR